jgi:pimeloyl-ACP methyl ester carboxylesterase
MESVKVSRIELEYDVVGSGGAAVAAQLALDHPETVHTLILLELSLLSLPQWRSLPRRGRACVRDVRKRRPRRRVGHVHERRQRPRLDNVPSAARGACSRRGGAGDRRSRHLLRHRAALADHVGFRRRAGSHHPAARSLGAGHRDPAAVAGGRRLPPLLTPARRGVRDRASAISCTSNVPSPSLEQWRTSSGETRWSRLRSRPTARTRRALR